MIVDCRLHEFSIINHQSTIDNPIPCTLKSGSSPRCSGWLRALVFVASYVTRNSFTTPYDDDLELTEKIASRVTDILLETGHYILVGVHQENERPVSFHSPFRKQA